MEKRWGTGGTAAGGNGHRMGMDGNSLERERESMNLVAKRFTGKARVRNSSETRANHMCMHNCTMRNMFLQILITTMFLNTGSDKAQWHMPERSQVQEHPGLKEQATALEKTNYENVIRPQLIQNNREKRENQMQKLIGLVRLTRAAPAGQT